MKLATINSALRWIGLVLVVSVGKGVPISFEITTVRDYAKRPKVKS